MAVFSFNEIESKLSKRLCFAKLAMCVHVTLGVHNGWIPKATFESDFTDTRANAYQ